MSDLVLWLILLALINLTWTVGGLKKKSDHDSIDIDWGEILPIVGVIAVVLIGILTFPALMNRISEIQGSNPQIAQQVGFSQMVSALPWVFLAANGLIVAVTVVNWRTRK